MEANEAARLLRERATSYSQDADMLDRENEPDLRLIYRTVADELRKVAGEMEAA